MNPEIPINNVLVENEALRYGLTERILSNVQCDHIEVINTKTHYENALAGSYNYDPDKGTLRLVSFPGEMLKPCPGTTNYICCGYQILHVGTNCPLDCSYCILQAYFNQPSLIIHSNLEEQFKSIFEFIDGHQDRIFRIGTGEFTDSLALDPITGWTNLLLPPFSKRKNTILELKTKTDHIQGLLSSPFRNQIIVSWSVNSSKIASKEEHRAPSIRKRLEAAKRCQDEGFVLGFHFDPLIEHHGWKDEYRKTVDMMDQMLDPKGIIWVSLGTLRFMPALKAIIRKRHPKSHILDGEFIPGLDGKMRYLKSIRIDMYAFMEEVLSQWYGDLGLYLCMESNEVWKKGLGRDMLSSEQLCHYLDDRVRKFFGDTPTC